MTVQGVVILDLIGLLILLWLLNLIRRGRLYVGYGVIIMPAIVITMITISVRPLLTIVTRLLGAAFPASALTLLALGFLFLMLVYVLTQLTVVSNRVAVLVQELAIERARPSAPPDVVRDDADAQGKT